MFYFSNLLNLKKLKNCVDLLSPISFKIIMHIASVVDIAYLFNNTRSRKHINEPICYNSRIVQGCIVCINLIRSPRFIFIKFIVLIYFIENIKCSIKPVIFFQHCFFCVSQVIAVGCRLLLLPPLLTLNGLVDLPLFFMPVNIASSSFIILLLLLLCSSHYYYLPDCHQ